MEYMTADTKVNGYMVYPRFLSTIDVSPTEKIVYIYLFNRARSSQRASRSGKFADQLGRVYIVYPIKDLAADTGFTERWVKKSLKELEEAELIERNREGNNHSPLRGTILHL